jgi:serine/threonine-protein kinase
MNGGSVKDRLESRGPIPLSEAAKIIERMAAVLDEAHRQNIVHRDVKPENILLDHTGDTFLADFGIVKLLSGSATTTSAGWITGTPAYMSPEQVHGEFEIDGRADIYSLAIVLFEMVSGKRPYYDDNHTKLMIKHVLDPVPRITKLLPDAPAGLEDVLMKALAKKPEDRYDTAGQFSEAVNGVGRAILSRRARKRWMADELADALDSIGQDEE